MHMFNMPSDYYAQILSSERVRKFTKVHVNSFFGRKRAAMFLRTTPIEDIPLYIAEPGYETKLSKFYPVYMGEIVMIGYLIVNKSKKYDFEVSDSKVIVRKNIVADDHYQPGFVSKQMLMLESGSANLFIPSTKYDD